MKINVFIQARMASTRLPGKVMMELAGHPMLYHVLMRAESMGEWIDEVVVLTGAYQDNKEIADFCAEGYADCFTCENENNVLGRFVSALENFPCDYVVRLTADNPLFDFNACSTLVKIISEHGLDYGEYKGYIGSRSEIIKSGILKDANRNAQTDYEREHVTPFMQNTSFYTKYKMQGYKEDTKYANYSVDTQEDFDRVSKIYDLHYKGEPIVI